MLTLAAAALLVPEWERLRAGQGPNFDKLNDADRAEFARRFERDVWPLLVRGGKDGCVGCHTTGKIVSSLKMKNDAGKDFRYMLREGFFIKGDPGSLLERMLTKDPKRRMPPDKLPGWTPAELKVLTDFVNDLDQKQKP
jgi:hypothetical protein